MRLRRLGPMAGVAYAAAALFRACPGDVHLRILFPEGIRKYGRVMIVFSVRVGYRTEEFCISVTQVADPGLVSFLRRWQ